MGNIPPMDDNEQQERERQSDGGTGGSPTPAPAPTPTPPPSSVPPVQQPDEPSPPQEGQGEWTEDAQEASEDQPPYNANAKQEDDES